MMKKTIFKPSTLLIFAGCAVILFSSLIFLIKTTELNFSYRIDTNIFDHFGSFVGGLAGAIFSLAGVFLIIETLKQQEREFIKNQVESRFFELLKAKESFLSNIDNHSNDVNLMETFWVELEETHNIVKKSSILSDRNQREIISITFLVFLFDVEQVERIINNFCSSISREEVVELLYQVSNSNYTINKQERLFKSSIIKAFNYTLSIMTYINNNSDVLDYNQKYSYIDILKNQTTVYEKLLFSFYLQTNLSRKWMLNSQSRVNEDLVSKYNFISEIEPIINHRIDFAELFPFIYLEDKSKSKQRKLIEKRYT